MNIKIYVVLIIVIILTVGCSNKSMVKELEEELRSEEEKSDTLEDKVDELELLLSDIQEENDEISNEMILANLENNQLVDELLISGETNEELVVIIEDLTIENNELLSSMDDKIHPIEQAYLTEINNFSTTQEAVEINTRYGGLWEEEMNMYYALIYDLLLDDRKHWLESAQDKWEEYIQENEELLWQSYDQQFHEGTIMQVLSSGIYYDRYKDRALYLEEIYDILSETY